MDVHPEIFKAYDIRGIYPGEIDEPTARQIGRGFVAYLAATRIALRVPELTGASRDEIVTSGVPLAKGTLPEERRT